MQTGGRKSAERESREGTHAAASKGMDLKGEYLSVASLIGADCVILNVNNLFLYAAIVENPVCRFLRPG